MLKKTALLLALLLPACASPDASSYLDKEKSDFAYPETAEFTQWRYQGPMPQMRDLELTISLDGRTLRVEGRPFLPTGDAPVELLEGDKVMAKYWPNEGRDLSQDEIESLVSDQDLDYLYQNEDNGKWFVVYPMAVGKTQFYPGDNKFDLVVPRRSASSHTWHQFPYIGYKSGRYGVGSIAFHTPYTTITEAGTPQGNARVGQTLHVFRGRVSVACKRMAPEHVLEFAHILGLSTDVASSSGATHRRAPYTSTLVDQLNSRGEGNFIHSISGWDEVNGAAVDVNYPTYGSIDVPANATVHSTWDAADFGRLEWVQFRDERGGEWASPPDPNDPFDNQISSHEYEEIEITNPLPEDHPDADTQ